MILSHILLLMSAMRWVDGNVWHQIKKDFPLPTPDDEKQTCSEMQCAMAASQNNYPLYCHGGTRCLLVGEGNLEEVLDIEKEGTPMKDLDVNWQCKIDRGE